MFWLGVCILLIFAALVGGMLYGCYVILVGGLQIKDPSIVAVVFTLIGSILGAVGALASQVASYYYGASHGSAVQREMLAKQHRASDLPKGDTP